MEQDNLQQRVEQLEKQSATQQKQIDCLTKNSIAVKDALNLEEASLYTGIKKSTLYKMTSTGAIPFYKPSGKLIFFDRKELVEWLLSNRMKTSDELRQDAMAYIMKKNLKP